MCQKRPTTVSKETYYSVKRDLVCVKRDLVCVKRDLVGRYLFPSGVFNFFNFRGASICREGGAKDRGAVERHD
jgi:hypothetical protein